MFTAVSSSVLSGSVSMCEVKLLLWKIVCFISLGGFVRNVSEYNGCCGFCICCLNCDARVVDGCILEVFWFPHVSAGYWCLVCTLWQF